MTCIVLVFAFVTANLQLFARIRSILFRKNNTADNAMLAEFCNFADCKRDYQPNKQYQMAKQEDVFKKIVSHAKEYGFVFPSSEIYDGLGAVYDLSLIHI